MGEEQLLGRRPRLSIIMTEWEEPRISTRPAARSLTKTQIMHHLREQIASALDRNGRPILYREDVLHWHVDPHLEWDETGHLVGDPEALLVHPPGIWKKRPLPADDDMHNLVLASDYVRNPMDLATMEGACSAARLAANDILERDGGRIVERAYVQHDYQDANDSLGLRRIKAYHDQDFQRAGPSIRASKRDIRWRDDAGIGHARALLRLQRAFKKKPRR